MNQPAENLDKLKLDFISTVSHELRTPLTSIRGFAQTLIASRDKLSDEQQLKFLNIIKDQSDRLINLVENLLASSTKESSEKIIVLKPTQISITVENIVSVVKQKFSQKEFSINIQKTIPDVLVDNENFMQILLNLIENACKYSFDNSIIKINTNIIDEKYIKINIENDGQTISDKDKDKIFEKFTRLDNPMTRKTEGSGIGLYITKELVEKMNGKIKVESQGEHTIFSIIFPIATPENIIKNKLFEQNKGGLND